MKISLFATGSVGLEVAQFLATSDFDCVVLLQLAGEDKENDNAIVGALSEHSPRVLIGSSPGIRADAEKLSLDLGSDALITVYWPWIVSESLVKNIDTTVNFHPALLPYGRGWYPHVHNLLEGTRPGVSLHEIDFPVDSGRLWAQKEVDARPQDTAGTLHKRLQEEMSALFRENWERIRDRLIDPWKQADDGAVYLAKGAVRQLDEIDLDSPTTMRQALNLLRARSFGRRAFAYFMTDDGQKIYINLRLSPDPIFQD